MPENNHVCWNCCGLRFVSDADDPVCPNCGELISNDIDIAVYYEDEEEGH